MILLTETLQENPRIRQKRGANRRPGFRPCPRLPVEKIRLYQVEGTKKVPMRCKSWHECRACGEWLKRRFLAVAIQQAEKRGLTKFLTITLPSHKHGLGVVDSSKELSRVWAAFRKEVGRHPGWEPVLDADGKPVLRKDGKPKVRVVMKDDLNRRVKTGPLNSIWVKEYHKDGTAHLHVLTDRWFHADFLQEQLVRAGAGEIYKIKKVPSTGKVAAYVTKYLTKSLREMPDKARLVIKNLRRYGTTGDCSMLGVYPVKQTDDVWWVEYRVPDGNELGVDWWACGSHDEVRQVIWSVVHCNGDLPPPKSLVMLRLEDRMAQAMRGKRVLSVSGLGVA